jgi:tRNA threonylcarbamoyladenosine biosynthesis protein TsaE
MQSRVFETKSVEETETLGATLASEFQGGDVICLHGNLGAGKTAWVTGLARGLKVARPVSSPTFTLVNEYPGGTLPVYHFDLYRMNHPMELEDIGYEEYFYGRGISVIEWAEKALALMPLLRWDITFDILGQEARRITVKAPAAKEKKP